MTGQRTARVLGFGLIVRDVASATSFYTSVLGGQELARAPNGMWARIRIGDTQLNVLRENPHLAEAPQNWPRSPVSAGAASVGFELEVDDVDAVYAAALAAGARAQTAQGPQTLKASGLRLVQFYDPQGHLWRLQAQIKVQLEESAA